METKTLVNLNTAEESELAQVPGIGPALAERIVVARPFASFDDVRRVPGIGASTLDKIAPYITVEETPFAEAEAPIIEVAPEGLGFVDMTPPEDKEEQRVAEVPADLVPLPPLPVVPPWNEDEAEALVAASAPEALPATEEAQAVVAPPLPETPPPLPEAPPEATVTAQPPTSRAQPKPQTRQPPAPTPASPRPVTRAQLAWVSFFVFVVTLLIALALSLGILAGLNGGLYFASPDDVAQISRQVSALQGEVDTLDQSLSSVQTRLNNLEALSGRIQALETAKGDLQREVEALTTQAEALDTRLQDLAQETTTLNTQMEKVQAQSERVQQVMGGLRDLLNSLFPEE
jgi:competence ComEA-like helix-hairpin-helix protein